MIIHPAQIRAGRALLGWSADELARRSGLSSTTINRAEAPQGAGIDAVVAIVTALRESGVTLTKTGSLVGVALDTAKVGPAEDRR